LSLLNSFSYLKLKTLNLKLREAVELTNSIKSSPALLLEAPRGFPVRKGSDMVAHPGGMRPRSKEGANQRTLLLLNQSTSLS